MRDLTIRAAMNGYTVQAGCRTLVFETDEALLVSLKAYLKDPKVVEETFLKNERHRENYPVEAQTQPAPAIPNNYTIGTLTSQVYSSQTNR